ncbi:MAG: aspartate carbamoyltransferase regulatory subunit [Bacteroidales bacterium]|nr:aspartate carbamoyltransferase regulatory subunit [Bacteroidales bacterium]
MDKKTEMVVPAIQNGTVIDHIPTNAVYQVIHLLGLEKYEDEVLIGNNLSSKKFNRKGIIKVKNRHFSKEEISMIALVAPMATIVTIKDYEVISKLDAEIPDQIEGIIKCMNPMCITNHETITTKFDVVDKENIKLKCHYCEKFTTAEGLHFD